MPWECGKQGFEDKMNEMTFRPEILRMWIIEVMSLRRFTQTSDGPNSQVSTIEDFLSRGVPKDELKTHLEKTGEAILNLARQGYPKLALGYIPGFTTMYKELHIEDTNLTTG